jgi:hypothetical protein
LFLAILFLSGPVPAKMSDKKGGLLIVSINPSPCINAQEVLFHFGREPEVLAEPLELWFCYQYPFPWGDLRFAFSAGEPACLGLWPSMP